MNRYASRKFQLASAAFLVASAGLFAGKLNGGEWISAITLILTLYFGGSVADKKLNGQQAAG